MEISGDQLKVSTADRDENGKQIDAEERTAVRELTTQVDIGLSNNQSVEEYTHGEASSSKTSTIETAGTAIEFAMGFRGRCRLCKHFDHAQFLRWKHDVEASGDLKRRAVLNELRGQILGKGYAQMIDTHQGQDGDLDVEHALNEFGICPAMSEVLSDLVFVWPDAGCPTQTPTGEPFDSLFVPRDAEAEREGTRGYDSILKAAQGTTKRKTRKIDLFTPKK